MPDAPKAYTLFMLVRATAEWLGLPPAERFGLLDRAVRPLLAAHPAVSLRLFDTEAYAARVSEVLMWRTADLGAWESLVEGLRETPFWAATSRCWRSCRASRTPTRRTTARRRSAADAPGRVAPRHGR
jgi:hypothetical protein